MSQSLPQLIEWYCAQCDGLWEHSYGISITTIDNPGFDVAINLRDTPLEHALFDSQDLELGNDGGGEWLICWKADDATWHGACSPRSLEQVVEIFLKWSSEQQPTAGP